MALKSGSTAPGLAAAGTGVTGTCAWAVVAAAFAALAKYTAPAGTAMVTAPMRAATNGFLRRFGRCMAILRRIESPSKSAVTVGGQPYGSLKKAPRVPDTP